MARIVGDGELAATLSAERRRIAQRVPACGEIAAQFLVVLEEAAKNGWDRVSGRAGHETIESKAH